MNNSSNYYEILGIEYTASNEDIKRAYRKLSLIYHPDKHNNEHDKSIKFQQLNEAYETLSNNILRDKYNRQNNINVENSNLKNKTCYNTCDNTSDNTYDTKNVSNPSQQLLYPSINPYINSNMNHTNMNSYMSSNMNPYMQCNLNPYMNSNTYADSISNSYQNIPKTIEIIKHINFYQSYNGDNVPVLINRQITVNSDNYTENETIYIDIEPGTDNNEIIIVKNKGNIINNIYGDVKIKFLLENNDIFSRKGLDIVYTKTITFKESVCGFSFILKHINGKSYTINNNTGVIINPNYNTSIPKLGFKKKDSIGNLIINYNIQYPERLDNKIITILKNVL